MPTSIIYFLFLLFCIYFCDCISYTNYSLYRAIPVKDSHLSFLEGLKERYDVNFWKEPGMLYQAVDFVINPKDRKNFTKEAKKLGVHFNKTMDDVQSAFDQQKVRKYIKRQMTSMNWETYYRLDDIYNWLSDLSNKHPREVQVKSIGKTHEKRDIMAVRVVLRGSPMRSIIMIEGGIHAREWISIPVVTYLLNSIVNAPSSNDNTLKLIARTYEWYFVPVLNPDGYEYTHTKDRLWRKNRNGYGVDLNRNFGIEFGKFGTSRDMVSEIYGGRSAFSENESKAMAALVRAKRHKLEYYINFHSYGQYMVIPYGYSKLEKDNYADVYQMCKVASQKIYEKYGTSYGFGTSYETIAYMASGLSCCWAKKTFLIPYVIALELRDKGRYGFALPTEEILPTCIETQEGLMSFFYPRSKKFRDKKRDDSSSHGKNILDRTVFLFDVLLFIILHFE